MSSPRKHHYIPQFYLSAFCDTIDSQLWVLDKAKFNRFETGTGNVAHERDFLRLEGEECKGPFILEQIPSELEGKVAPLIEKIIKDAVLPEGDDLDLLLHFIALIAAKIPQKRIIWDDFMGQIGEGMLSMLLENEERWERAVSASGAGIDDENSKEAYWGVNGLLDKKQLKVGASQTAHLHFFINSSEIIWKLLPQRNWGIFIAEEGEFITSDNPVVLAWNKSIGSMSPGFGLPGTSVFFSISPKVVLAGTFEPISQLSNLDRRQLSAINSLILLRGNRFVFSRIKEFECFSRGGDIETASQIVERAKLSTTEKTIK